MRIRGALIALCACAGALALIAAPAGAAEKAIWGPTKLPQGGSAFPTYQQLGVDTYQVQLSFQAVAPSRPANPSNPADPAFRWPAGLDATIAEANRHGIKVAILVSKSPPWANGGQSDIHAPRPGDFARFMATASRRYPSVRRWMIWGEPNRADRFQPNGSGGVSARAYAPILDASYSALKGVSRRNIVIGGMTWTGGTVKPARFLKYMRLPGGRPPRLDWFGHNPFPFRFPNLRELPIAGGWRDISDLDTFGPELRRTYARPCTRRERRRGRRRCGPRPRFWLSEFLVQSDHGSSVFERFVSRAEQARWLRAAYRIADRLPSVAGLGWLSLVDEPEAKGSAPWGLLTATGAPKPAYGAYLGAPSERLRPAVRAPRRVSRARLRRRSLIVRVQPRAGGRVQVTLRSSGGRLIKRVGRRARAGRRLTLRLNLRRRVARGLRKGPYRLTVVASRGSRVNRSVTLR